MFLSVPVWRNHDFSRPNQAKWTTVNNNVVRNIKRSLVFEFEMMIKTLGCLAHRMNPQRCIMRPFATPHVNL